MSRDERQKVAAALKQAESSSIQQLVQNAGIVEATRAKASYPRRTEKVDVGNGNIIEAFTHDEYGLVLDPKSWAKKNCKQRIINLGGGVKSTQRGCKGKGFRWRVRLEDKHREMVSCECAVERYQNKRSEVERRLTGIEESCKVSSGVRDVQAELDAELTKIHRELGSDLILRVVRLDGHYYGELCVVQSVVEVRENTHGIVFSKP